MPVAELMHHVGISEQTFYRRKNVYAGLQRDEVRQLKQLQDENVQLKKVVTELMLDKALLTDVLEKSGKALAEAQRRGLSRISLWRRRAARLPRWRAYRARRTSIPVTATRRLHCGSACVKARRRGYDVDIGRYACCSCGRVIGPARIGCTVCIERKVCRCATDQIANDAPR